LDQTPTGTKENFGIFAGQPEGLKLGLTVPELMPTRGITLSDIKLPI